MNIPWWKRMILNVLDWIYEWSLRRKSSREEHWFLTNRDGVVRGQK